MKILEQFSKQALASSALTETELSAINTSLINLLSQAEKLDFPGGFHASEIDKVIALANHLPDIAGKETDPHSTFCDVVLDVLGLLYERKSSELSDHLFRKLSAETGRILLNVLLEMSKSCIHFLRRFAEAFSILMESLCDRIKSSKLRLLQHVHFLLTDEDQCFRAGKFIGECGNFLVQANMIEALLKLIQKLRHLKVTSISKTICFRICNGILDGNNVESSQATYLATSLLSIAESMDKNLGTTVQKIRSWINIANDIRSKYALSTVTSFTSKKLLLDAKDMDYPFWVDFNLHEITITGMHPNPIALALNYKDIIKAKGNRSSSSLTLHVAKIQDLLESGEQNVSLITIEFTRSDFPSALNHITKQNVTIHHAQPQSNLRQFNKEKLPKERITPVRKASITFSTKVLETFINTNQEETKSSMPVGPQKCSGGMPVSQVNTNLKKRTREFIATSQPLSPKHVIIGESEKHDKEGASGCGMTEWKQRADLFRKEYKCLQDQFIEASEKLVEHFINDTEQFMTTRKENATLPTEFGKTPETDIRTNIAVSG